MSASLVGSEMCIRDSARGAPTMVHNAPNTVVCAFGLRPRVPQIVGGCLEQRTTTPNRGRKHAERL
eukprot:15081800-Alexandrium_andersonii.AAC.1